MECYARLQEERLRLDLSRKRVAEIAGASERTVSRWERDNAMPIDALIALSEQGYDAQYVCTGRRSVNSKAAAGTRKRKVAAEPAYTREEIEWITRLRKLDPDKRQQLKAVLDALAPRRRKSAKGA